jgi:hypothetical protein
MRAFFVLVLLLGFAIIAEATTYRDPHQRAAFMKYHQCPSTGQARGACPGYVVDHIKPLCAGGADAVADGERGEGEGQARAKAVQKVKLG